MARLIKRYGSRKLYDTTESRYVSLEEIAAWIRNGEEIEVQDNATSEDVSAQTLTQIISEEGRKRSLLLSPELLHDLIRAGGSAVTSRVKQIQNGVEGFVKKSLDRIVPVSRVRDEMSQLRSRLNELETALAAAEKTEAQSKDAPETQAKDLPVEGDGVAKKTTRKTPVRKTTAAKTARSPRKTTAKKTAAEKVTAEKVEQVEKNEVES